MQSAKVKGRKAFAYFCLLLFTFALAAAAATICRTSRVIRLIRRAISLPTSAHRAICPRERFARGSAARKQGFLHGQKRKRRTSNAPVQTTTDATGNTLVSSFPNDIDEFPVPVTKELVDRGQERFNIYCIVCHGPVGNGDGMIVRRGFPKPPTYHDDRLRNAPVGHFFDVMTNGWGKMNSYASQVQSADRWAIVAYIRALQISQNPDENFEDDIRTNDTATPAAIADTEHARRRTLNGERVTDYQSTGRDRPLADARARRRRHRADHLGGRRLFRHGAGAALVASRLYLLGRHRHRLPRHSDSAVSDGRRVGRRHSPHSRSRFAHAAAHRYCCLSRSRSASTMNLYEWTHLPPTDHVMEHRGCVYDAVVLDRRARSIYFAFCGVMVVPAQQMVARAGRDDDCTRNRARLLEKSDRVFRADDGYLML